MKLSEAQELKTKVRFLKNGSGGIYIGDHHNVTNIGSHKVKPAKKV